MMYHSMQIKNESPALLLETWYIHSLESLLVHIFRFFENFEIWGGFFEKLKKKC